MCVRAGRHGGWRAGWRRGGPEHLDIPGQHQLQRVFGDGIIRHFVQGLQQLHGILGLGLGAVDLELLVAVGNLDLHAHFDGAQVRIGRTAQMGQAGVVVRRKGVAQDHADNSLLGKPQPWWAAHKKG